MIEALLRYFEISNLKYEPANLPALDTLEGAESFRVTALHKGKPLEMFVVAKNIPDDVKRIMGGVTK